MSSDELNEAVLLETAIFSDLSDQTSHNMSTCPNLQHCPERIVDPKQQCLPTPISQSITETRLLREQQVLNPCL